MLAIGRRRHHSSGVFEHALQVTPAAALRHETAARRRAPCRRSEDRRVIVNPVQRRRAEDGVERLGKRQRRAVGLDIAIGLSDTARVGPCHRQHRSGRVEPDDPPRRAVAGGLDDFLGQPAGAAAEIEDALAGRRLQARDDALTPVELRLRNPVISRGIPVGHVVGSDLRSQPPASYLSR